MIKFFRKIRQNLIMENKTGKPALPAGRYFKYAIGEIVLVVIGILIALQINNWNQNRQQRQQEHKLLLSLKADFVESQSRLQQTMKTQQRAIKNSSKLLKIYENKIPRPNNDSIMYFIAYGAESWYRAELLTGAYDAYISTGNSELIQNDKLIKMLAEYFSIVKSGFEDQENSMNLLNNMQQILAPVRAHIEVSKLRQLIGLDTLRSPKEDMAINYFFEQDAYFGHLMNRAVLEELRLSIQNDIFEKQSQIIAVLNKEIELLND
jgi:hypothetical protein